jgi:histidinol-phosphate aminotransferase
MKERIPMSIILPHIDRLKPYMSGAATPNNGTAIRLHLNENPYPPSERVLAALQSIGERLVRRYPDNQNGMLRSAVARHYGRNEDEVFCGNGSSEIISLLFKAFLGPGRRIAIPDPSFALYQTVAAIHRTACERIPNLEDLSIDVEALVRSTADAAVLVNPHAPSGKLLPLDEVERIAKHYRGLIIVDEAYIDFCSDVHGAPPTALPLLGKYPNLLILRTFSKAYAMCGMRVGYCFASPALIGALNKAKDLYNVDQVSAVLAAAALSDEAYLKQTTAAIRRTRDAFSAAMTGLGFHVYSSDTNFVLCSVPASLGANGAQSLCSMLAERNIHVRHFDTPRLCDKLRISIGTDAEMDALLKELSTLLG